MGLVRSVLRFLVVECPVIPLLLIAPFSLLSDIYLYTAIKLSYKSLKRLDNRDKHDRRVRDIQRQVRQWIAAGSGAKMCTARPSYKNISMMQEFTYKKTMHQVRRLIEDTCTVDNCLNEYMI